MDKQQYIQSLSETDQMADGSAGEFPSDIIHMDFQTIKAASDNYRV